MTENLETKSKPPYKYQIDDFVAGVGLGNYAKRNRDINGEDNHNYIMHLIGLVAFNATGYIISTYITTQALNLIK